MTFLTIETGQAIANAVRITDEELVVGLVDGRTMSVPLLWYPRLAHASEAERGNWRFIGRGERIHWPSIDEDIEIANLLVGRRSGESQESLQASLAERASS
jgi:uncharacterized protein DUF2442